MALSVEYRLKYCHTYEIDSLACTFFLFSHRDHNESGGYLLQTKNEMFRLDKTESNDRRRNIVIEEKILLHLATKLLSKGQKFKEQWNLMEQHVRCANTHWVNFCIRCNNIAHGMLNAQWQKRQRHNLQHSIDWYKKMYNHHDDCDCHCDVLAFLFYSFCL